MSGPLSGVKILDCTTVVLGPWAAQQLGDLGADVIKIEPPGGDTTRQLGPRRRDNMAAFFLGCNRNKRSIVLDLKKEEGRAALLKLAEDADVLMHNYRPAPAERLGELGDDRVAGNGKPTTPEPLGTELWIRQRHQRVERSATIVRRKHIKSKRASNVSNDCGSGFDRRGNIADRAVRRGDQDEVDIVGGVRNRDATPPHLQHIEVVEIIDRFGKRATRPARADDSDKDHRSSNRPTARTPSASAAAPAS